MRGLGAKVRNAAAAHQLLSFLAWDWSGFALGFGLTLTGAALIVRWPVTGLSLALVGLCLALGASRYLVQRVRVRRRFPAPGQLIDIGGYRLHLLAEGRGPSVVWLGGAHSGSYVMRHLHDVAVGEFRSILVDRPGTGWSDTGPFPRSTSREAEEVMAALERANERGPFIFAGHSFGGLLAANIARRNPAQTAGLVLIDATPPDTIVYGPRLSSLRAMRAATLQLAIERLIGFGLKGAPEADHPVLRQYAKVLGDHQIAGNAVEASVGNALASWSIYRELTPHGLADVAWEAVVYDGDLGDLPVVVLFPDDPVDAAENEIGLLPEYVRAGEAEQRRMRNFFARNRLRYLASSTNARRMAAPAGSGHNFPYFYPELVIAAVRSVAKGPDGLGAG